VLSIDPDDPTPIYAQLEQAIRAEIVSGLLPTGAQLPTVRQLAMDLRINANTVAKVYSALERVGVLKTQRGVGTFVGESGEPYATRPSARERVLHQLSDRLLAGAHAAGLTIDEIIGHLESRRR